MSDTIIYPCTKTALSGLKDTRTLTPGPGGLLEVELTTPTGEVVPARIRLEEQIGKGSTCLVYKGRQIARKGYNDLDVIVKEFYPRLDGPGRDIHRDERGILSFGPAAVRDRHFQARKDQFIKSFRMQRELNSRNVKLMVRPIGTFRLGDSLYAVSDFNEGRALDPDAFTKFSDKLLLMEKLADMVRLLHRKNYIFTDMKFGNILWDSSDGQILLYDADSFINMEELDKLEEIYGDPQIEPEEIRRLIRLYGQDPKGFREKVADTVSLESDYFRLGILYFYILTGTYPCRGEDPGPTDREGAKPFFEMKEEGLQGASRDLLKRIRERILVPDTSAAKAGEIRDMLLEVLKKCLCRRLNRYQYDPEKDDLLTDIRKIRSVYSSAQSRKKPEYGNADPETVGYYILEKFPLYKFRVRSGLPEGTEGPSEAIRVMMIGSDPIREGFLKTVLPCGQMLTRLPDGRLEKTGLEVRLVSENASAFWQDYTSTNKNMDLNKIVSVTVNGTPQMGNLDRKISREPLARIDLIDHQPDPAGEDEVLQAAIREGFRYFLLLDPDREKNNALAEKLTACLETEDPSPVFIGLLEEHEDREETFGYRETGRVTVYPFGRTRVSHEFREVLVRNRYYKLGLMINAYYERGNDPRKRMADIEEKYKADSYYRNSSIRAAAHSYYKLVSAGIDPDDPAAPVLFYNNVIKKGRRDKVYKRLVQLEHQSWMVYMLTHGHYSVSPDMISRYAFQRDNDWKCRDLTGHTGQPCIRDARPEFGLSRKKEDWKRDLKTENPDAWNRLDELDRASLEIFRVLHETNLRNRAGIDGLYQELLRTDEIRQIPDGILRGENTGKLAARALVGEASLYRRWEKENEALIEAFRNHGLETIRIRMIFGDIQSLMKPAKQLSEYHDFKLSDEMILRAIPRLMLGRERIRIIHPVSGLGWADLWTSMVIEPQALALVCRKGLSEDEVLKLERYAAGCQAFLKDRGMETEVYLCTEDSLRNDDFRDILDISGHGGSLSVFDLERRICSRLQIGERDIISVNRYGLKTSVSSDLVLYDHPIELSVDETLRLFGCEDIDRDKENRASQIPISQIRAFWHLCFQLGSGWDDFYQLARKMKGDSKRRISLVRKDVRSFCSIGIAGSKLEETGLGDLLHQAVNEGWIGKLQVPLKGQTGPVSFETDRQELGACLIEAIGDPESGNEKVFYKFMDQNPSMIMVTKISNRISGLFTEREKDILKKGLDFLNRNYKNQIVQDVAFSPENDKFRITLVLVNPLLTDLLDKNGTVLEALVYSELYEKGIFDDIRMNVRVLWKNQITENEIDVMGTKGGQTYLISVKNRNLEKDHLQEIYTLQEKFAIGGHAALIASRKDTSGMAVQQRAEELGIICLAGDQVSQETGPGKIRIPFPDTFLNRMNKLVNEERKKELWK